MPTVSVENYLKALFHLQGEAPNRVKTKELADRLELSLPSSTNMLKSLSERGFVDYVPYRGARLTDDGRRHALKVIRAHRLIECFLVETLGYTWDEVHSEAESLEHAVSEVLIDRIDAYLSFPRFDPHGDPIPTADGSLERRELVRLLDVEPVTRVELLRVTNQDGDVLRYLNDVGLRPQTRVDVIEVMPFDGPFRLARADGSEVTISRILASCLLVRKLSPPSE